MRGVRSVLMGAVACALLAGCATGGVSDLSSEGVTLEGTVETGNFPATYWFEYATRTGDLGTTSDYETPRRDLAPNTETAVEERVTGYLNPSSVYAYRLCGQIATRTGCLATRRFTVPPDGATSTTFDQPGQHVFTVPAGVTRLSANVSGGAGGNAPASYLRGNTPEADGVGGSGATLRADLKVTPGEKLTVRVGDRGGDALPPDFGVFPGAGGRGGSNGAGRGGDGGSGSGKFFLEILLNVGAGGGGGGASSEIRDASGKPLMVAGAGGGAGGSVAAPGADGGLKGAGSYGAYPAPAGGGTTSAGGAGGSRNASSGSASDGGDGGQGGYDPDEIKWPCVSGAVTGGGGGGGGWFGGGGGGGGNFVMDYSIDCGPPFSPYSGTFRSEPTAGGGGGSSYVDESAVETRWGIRGGDEAAAGVVGFTWVPAPAGV